MSTLNEKTAFITGGGRGIGRAIALTFSGAGATVAVAGRNQEALDEVCATIEQRGGRAVAVICDVADPMQVYAAVSQARAAVGPFDILVNNAGVTYSAKLTDTDDALWERIIQVNLNGAY